MTLRNFFKTVWQYLCPFVLHLVFYSVIWKENVMTAILDHEEEDDILSDRKELGSRRTNGTEPPH